MEDQLQDRLKVLLFDPKVWQTTILSLFSKVFMGTLKSFFDANKLTPAAVAITSKRVETYDNTSRSLQLKRFGKRADKEFIKRVGKDTAAKKYTESNIEKPKQMGRGVTEKAVNMALAEKPVSRKTRTKILKSVNTILTGKKQAAVEMKALFEGSKARAGKKPVVEKKK
jgi:hypothetical protein